MGEKNSSDLFVNIGLGFTSVLVLILTIALGTRIIYPRVQTQRSTEVPQLIGEIIQLEVLNGCGVSGLATKFTDFLRTNGFDVIESGNFHNYDVQESFVIDRTGNKQHAHQLAKALGINQSNVIQQISPNYYLDATLVLGADYKSLKAGVK